VDGEGVRLMFDSQRWEGREQELDALCGLRVKIARIKRLSGKEEGAIASAGLQNEWQHFLITSAETLQKMKDRIAEMEIELRVDQEAKNKVVCPHCGAMVEPKGQLSVDGLYSVCPECGEEFKEEA